MDFLNLTRNSSFSLDSFENDLSKLCNEDWEVVCTFCIYLKTIILQGFYRLRDTAFSQINTLIYHDFQNEAKASLGYRCIG